MDSLYRQELSTALGAVRLAARLCRNVQAAITPDVLEKKDRSPVTVADYGSQAIVCRALSTAFPDDAILAEEDAAALRDPSQTGFADRICHELARVGIVASADEACGWIDRGSAAGGRGRFWTLDPIDGTKGFLRREQYAVSLALLVDGRIELAALACPNLPIDPQWESTGTVFFAIRGQGALAMPLDDDAPPRPVRVSATSDPSAARVCESVESGHSSHDASRGIATRLGIVAEPVRLDSQAKYGVVARGEADIYLRLPTRADYHEKIWDHAGGVLVVEEAGGKVTDVLGQPLQFDLGASLTANRGVIVTNGRLHDAVVATARAEGVA